MPVVPRFRLGLDELVHIILFTNRRDERLNYWTPACNPDQEWFIQRGAAVEQRPTCLACLACPR